MTWAIGRSGDRHGEGSVDISSWSGMGRLNKDTRHRHADIFSPCCSMQLHDVTVARSGESPRFGEKEVGCLGTRWVMSLLARSCSLAGWHSDASRSPLSFPWPQHSERCASPKRVLLQKASHFPPPKEMTFGRVVFDDILLGAQESAARAP